MSIVIMVAQVENAYPQHQAAHQDIWMSLDVQETGSKENMFILTALLAG
jgi:hypothetical protein